jgi:hypothetical protein
MVTPAGGRKLPGGASKLPAGWLPQWENPGKRTGLQGGHASERTRSDHPNSKNSPLNCEPRQPETYISLTTTDHRPPTNAQTTTAHQPSTINHQPSTINHQPPTTNHQPPPTNH